MSKLINTTTSKGEVMTIKNADMPAMPCDKSIDTKESWEYLTAGGRFVPADGLTKREMFAMHAMNTVLSSYNPYESGTFDSSNWEETAKNCVGLADALLKELEK